MLDKGTLAPGRNTNVPSYPKNKGASALRFFFLNFCTRARAWYGLPQASLGATSEENWTSVRRDKMKRTSWGNPLWDGMSKEFFDQRIKTGKFAYRASFAFPTSQFSSAGPSNRPLQRPRVFASVRKKVWNIFHMANISYFSSVRFLLSFFTIQYFFTGKYQ